MSKDLNLGKQKRTVNNSISDTFQRNLAVSGNLLNIK